MVQRVGFTGTQHGMTPAQKESLFRVLHWFREGQLHHGDCVGADAEAHDVALELGLHVVIHPPTNGSKRAFMSGGSVLPAKGYLVRNRDIVDSADWLIAAPQSPSEQLRSGTWSTVRYARRKRKNVTIILPDGSVHTSGAPQGVASNGNDAT